MAWLAAMMWMLAPPPALPPPALPAPELPAPERTEALAPASPLEAAVLARINRVRVDPQAYADELRAYRLRFDGLVVYDEESPAGILTHEGVAAVDEAIAFLDRQTGLPPLQPGAVLALGAADLVADHGPGGRIGHVSSGGASPGDRVRRRGGDIYVGEVVSYGHGVAAGVVRQLIIDDGVAGRGHRALLFARGYRYAGVACGPHDRYGAMCVVDMAATPSGMPELPRLADISPRP